MHMTVIAVLCISSTCIARSEEQQPEQQPAEQISHKVYRLSYQKAADVEKAYQDLSIQGRSGGLR